MLPGRLGLRFALEALFLVLLAVGAGLAGLRPLYIVLLMAVAWVLVAIVEYTADRISRAPLSYLLPPPAEPVDEEAEPAWPMPEERTVVAPPQERPPVPLPEPEPEPAAIEAPPVEPEVTPLPEPQPEPEPELEPAAEESDEPRKRRFGFLRRSERDEEEEHEPPPRHVKLLPRRTAPESSRVSKEVAELFDRPDEPEERSG